MPKRGSVGGEPTRRHRTTEQAQYFDFRSLVLAELAEFNRGTSFQWRQKEVPIFISSPQFHFAATCVLGYCVLFAYFWTYFWTNSYKFQNSTKMLENISKYYKFYENVRKCYKFK